MTSQGGDVPAASLQLWLADLELLHGALQRLEADAGLLAADEKVWPQSGRLETQRHRVLTRIVLRLLLARAGAVGARGQPFAIDQHGKPHLRSGVPAFNVSHSGGFALVAIAMRGPVGVDLETERVVRLGAARRALVVAAGNGLGGRIETVNHVASGFGPFLRAWTMLEALAKAEGSGAGHLLTELGITASGVRQYSPADVARKAEGIAAAAGLAVAAVDLPVGFYGAVCATATGIADGVRVQHLTVQSCRLDDASDPSRGG